QPSYAPSVLKTGSWATSNSDQTLNWRDLDWIRERWKGKLVLKGVLDVADASSMAPLGRFRFCRISQTRSVTGSKCCSTAAYGRAMTCSRRWRTAHAD